LSPYALEAFSALAFRFSDVLFLAAACCLPLLPAACLLSPAGCWLWVSASTASYLAAICGVGVLPCCCCAALFDEKN